VIFSLSYRDFQSKVDNKRRHIDFRQISGSDYGQQQYCQTAFSVHAESASDDYNF